MDIVLTIFRLNIVKPLPPLIKKIKNNTASYLVKSIFVYAFGRIVVGSNADIITLKKTIKKARNDRT